MSEIKNCPFCNGTAIMRERFINGVANVKHYRLECVDCHASFLNWNKNTSKAIAAWNRRTDHIRDTTKKVSNADRIRGMSDEELGVEAWFAPSGEDKYAHELELRHKQREESK